VILYLDTSAFIKLYVLEPGSDLVRDAVRQAAVTVTHLITYAEMRAALARLHAMGRCDPSELSSHKKQLERDWQTLHCVVPDEGTIREAGDLAETHGLRGYDSLHLARAWRLARQLHTEVTFACFDRKLNSTARIVGLGILDGMPDRR
jgi:predicted nucleic acid-binding protein